MRIEHFMITAELQQKLHSGPAPVLESKPILDSLRNASPKDVHANPNLDISSWEHNKRMQADAMFHQCLFVELYDHGLHLPSKSSGSILASSSWGNAFPREIK